MGLTNFLDFRPELVRSLLDLFHVLADLLPDLLAGAAVELRFRSSHHLVHFSVQVDNDVHVIDLVDEEQPLSGSPRKAVDDEPFGVFRSEQHRLFYQIHYYGLQFCLSTVREIRAATPR